MRLHIDQFGSDDEYEFELSIKYVFENVLAQIDGRPKGTSISFYKADGNYTMVGANVIDNSVLTLIP